MSKRLRSIDTPVLASVISRMPDVLTANKRLASPSSVDDTPNQESSGSTSIVGRHPEQSVGNDAAETFGGDLLI